VKVAVFGLGYVGTVTAACLAANGHDVWGVDVEPSKVRSVNSGSSPVVEPGLPELIAEGLQHGSLHATLEPTEALDGADISMICVGTPSSSQSGTDLVHVSSVTDQIADALRKTSPGPAPIHAVVMRSTVPPGTVDALGERLARLLEGSGRRVGVAMCPEFLRESTAIADFYEPPYTVVGSSDPDTVRTVTELLAFVERPVHVVSTTTAEAVKYASNAFHATKVTFANEMGRVLRRQGVDAREVMQLFCQDDHLNISPAYLRPGFAFGGSCLPKDLRSLLYLARMENIDVPLLSGTLASNKLSVSDVVDRVVLAGGRTVALLGLSFKAASDDLRESPYVDLAEQLLGKGYDLRIFDPIVNPSALVGSNLAYVQDRLPHLRKLLTHCAATALEGADTAVVSCRHAEVVTALAASPVAQLIDLDGRLGPQIETRKGYQGVAW